MDNGVVVALANLLVAMKEGANKLESAINKKDAEQIALAKKELLYLQIQVKEML